MPNQVTNYKCPSCTAPLHFSGDSGKLECDYCGSVYEVAEIEKLYAEEEAKAAESKQQSNAESCTYDGDQWTAADGMKSYSCPSCGAELICDENTVATSCPYCGNPTVIPGQVSGGLKPDYIIPFKLDQEAAKAALKNHYRGKKLLPNSFSDENRIQEIKGVYVPFWLFDGKVDVRAEFEGRNINRFRSGNYEVTEIKHYAIHREGTIPFEKIPVDASSKMSDEYMDAIEPFDYSELTSFSSAYLPGFLADKYDISAKDCAARADDRTANSALSAICSDVAGYDSVDIKGKNINIHHEKVHYGLLPVYMLATKWEGKNYLFAMNGQTGKFIGDLPVDKGKYWKYFAAITAAGTAIIGTLLMLM